MKTFRLASLAAAAACTLPLASQAAEVYAGIGLPGVLVGVAQPVDGGRFTLRADYATLGSRSDDGEHEGIDYKGELKTGRFGLFGDWFFNGGWRATGGVTFNRVRVNLHFQGSGQAVTIGGVTTVATSSDRFDVEVKFPSTTPYLGIGYGHHAADTPGFGFVADLGVSIGRAKLRSTVSPSLLAKVGQANVDEELREIRDGVGKVRVLPQISVGVSYRF